MSNVIPYILEDTGRGERSMDIYSRLLVDRIVVVGSELNDQNVNVLIAQLLFLSNDSSKDIQIYINVQGGSLSAGLALYDVITLLSKKCDISTICIGQAISIGALILAAGTKGKRLALPHSRIMIHQPVGRVTGTSAEILVQAKELKSRKESMIKVLSACTSQSSERISKDIDRDYFLNVLEAIQYGIVDKICTHEDAKEESKSTVAA